MKISVIMVSYHAKDTIEQAIQSVIRQNYPEKELIIIDGQSEDETVDIIKRHAASIAYWCSEPDGGIYDAMNKGLAKATGEVIAFLNSDDWYEEGVFEKVREYFEKNEADILAGRVNHVLNGRVFAEKFVLHDREEIWTKMIYHHQGMFVKKEVYERIGNFNLKYRLSADYDWELRAYCAGCRFIEVEDVFANYRCDGLSSMQRYKGAREQREIACFHASSSEDLLKKINCYYREVGDMREETLYNWVWKHAREFVRSLCRDDVAYYIWGAGDYGKACCKMFWATGLKMACFIDNNRSESSCYGYPVISPEQLKGTEWICICSQWYETEIMNQIKETGHPMEQVILFTDLKKKMADYGKEHFMDVLID